MHIFKLKEGTKSYDWVKDVIDKERKQNAEYCDRIRKAIPFQLTRVIASYVNSTFSRKLEIYEFVVTPEEYETLDKEVWNRTYSDDNQFRVAPNLNNEEGRAIKEVMSSYPPVTTHDDILKKLGLRALIACRPFRPTNLTTHEGKYYFVLTDDLVIKDNDNNDDLELITEEDAKRLTGFKDERVDYSKKRMTNKDFFDAYRGKPALYKGKDIGAYVAGYVGEKYIILGFHDYTGCILRFTARVNKTLDVVYTSYRFAKLKYVEVVS